MLALNKQETQIMQVMFKELILFLLGAFFLAKVLAASFWLNYTVFCHTSLELICVFISFTIFLLVWYTYENSFVVNHLMCFCFFILGIFDILHLIFYSEKIMFAQINLSVWYWMAGRFTLALILLAITTELQIKLNKHVGLFLSLLVVSFVAIWFYKCREFLPILFVAEGYTKSKIVIDCLLISLFLFVLYNLRSKFIRQDVLAYQYLMSALLVAIIAEVCFIIKPSASFYNIGGHLLKATYYFFFLKGIFVSAVQYPYKKIAQTSESIIQVFDEIPLGIVIYDQYLRLFFANKKALNILTYQLQDIYGLHHDIIVQKFGFMNILEQKAKKEKVLKDVYTELKNKSGAKCKIRADYYKLSNSYLVLFEEVPDNQELETLKIQTRAVLNSINKVVILLDIKNRIIVCNKNCLEVLDMEEHEVIGKDVNELAILLSFKADGDIIKCKRNKRIQELHEVSITTLKGNKKDLFFHIDYINNLTEEKIGAIILATDITLFKKESLKMQQKEKLIALGQMAAGIVHEIKNPLTAIKGFSQLIKYKDQDEKMREYAAMIDRETEIINNFISDFLTFARPSPPDLKQISLNKIVKSMKLIIDTNTFIRDIKVSFDLSPVDKLIVADANQLRQVILNIVKNAMEAVVDNEGSEIKISTKYHRRTKEMSVTIYNNGKAMTAEEKLMVGTPFFTTKAKGTGLGLSICFQIIKEHNGRIEIESEEGVGTSFIVYLPCAT
ncbi:MAG: MASE3 domain-containing protein [Clostridia bacterium]|nr:MASE3 domain-containing protein [Clostridia bacterium]